MIAKTELSSRPWFMVYFTWRLMLPRVELKQSGAARANPKRSAPLTIKSVNHGSLQFAAHHCEPILEQAIEPAVGTDPERATAIFERESTVLLDRPVSVVNLTGRPELRK